ncbi:hypothetical protein TNCV_2397181 [Trichonephila clavipes]|uniref:Uncharacterized protein n=1 Tax=Trichonephila clavipes TaxID=2585209 RepID=A0A8X6SS24_TRICX|nr:hypothetical protein TNCV_2397181 [Trichonephila clavipes]
MSRLKRPPDDVVWKVEEGSQHKAQYHVEASMFILVPWPLAVGCLVTRASGFRPEGLGSMPAPPNTLRVHTVYVLGKSVGPVVLWAEIMSARKLENISLPFSSIPKLWKWRSVMSPSIVPSGISPS